jgi:hypothetical protein
MLRSIAVVALIFAAVSPTFADEDTPPFPTGLSLCGKEATGPQFPDGLRLTDRDFARLQWEREVDVLDAAQYD